MTFTEFFSLTNEEPEDLCKVTEGLVAAPSGGWTLATEPPHSPHHRELSPPPGPSKDCSLHSPYLCNLGPERASLLLTKCEH